MDNAVNLSSVCSLCFLPRPYPVVPRTLAVKSVYILRYCEKKKKKGGQVKHNSLSIDMTSYACFVFGYLRPLAVCFLHSFMRYECMDYDFFVLVSCNPCWSTEHQPTWLYIPIKPYILQSEPNQESIYIYIFLSLFTLLNDSHSNVEGET